MSRYYSKAELENSPSRRLGLDTKKETLFRWAACDLIKECGQRLKIPQLTIATATVFCHRFYAVHPHDSGENEWKTVAPACLFLAGKVEETPKALRDVVCVAYLWCHRKEQEAATERLKDKVRHTRLGGGGQWQTTLWGTLCCGLACASLPPGGAAWLSAGGHQRGWRKDPGRGAQAAAHAGL